MVPIFRIWLLRVLAHENIEFAGDLGFVSEKLDSARRTLPQTLNLTHLGCAHLLALSWLDLYCFLIFLCQQRTQASFDFFETVVQIIDLSLSVSPSRNLRLDCRA